MYESFFQFTQRPFAAAPQADRYFSAQAIESARQTLARCIERAEGAGMVVGPSGTGKTLLLQLLAEQFRGQFNVALLTNGHLTNRRALLQAILFELGLPYRGMEEGELRLSLIDHLSPSPDCPNGMVLLIDEAHRLPLRLMEEVRMITNLIRHGQPRVRLVMAGGPMLEERFASPKLESFSQRLSARCYLQAMDRSETIAYVRSQIAGMGGDPERIFTPEALDSIYQATDGIPRLINQLCDHALVLAFAGGRRQLTKGGIEEAWSDLQQLPTPWNESTRPVVGPSGEDSVIEFGRLEDDQDEPIDAGMPAVVGAVADSRDFDDEEPLVEISRMRPLDEPVEDDFEPIGTIGPEAEVNLAGLLDPFGEPFLEEEMVFERYASADAAMGSRTFVSGPESMALSAMLEPFLHPPAKPKLAVAAELARDEHESIELDSADAEYRLAAEEPAPVDEPLNPADDPVLPDEGWDERPMATESMPWQTSVATASPAAASPVANLITGDDNVMIIEENPQFTVKTAPPPVVRRQEYSQLFAKLRSGEK